MKTLTAFIFLFALTLSAQVTRTKQLPTRALTDDEYIENVLYKATGLLYSQDDQGRMNMRCTVTAIEKTEKGYIFVTAAHCAASDDEDKERVKPDKTYFFITSDSDTAGKDFMKAKLVAAGYQHESDDFALFEVETDKPFPLVAIGEDVAGHSGEPIVNIASPLGLGKQTFKGIVSSPKVARPLVSGSINWTEAMAVQLFGTNGGSSGSAIICLKQRAICGFLVGTIADTSMIAIQVSKFKAFQKAIKDGSYAYYPAKKDKK